MNIIATPLTKNPCYIAGKKITVKGLMLHSVGCPQPSAKVFARNWNTPITKVCVHAFIDANTGDVYQTLPWTHRGWHCGGSGNNTHIGVEMCEPSSIKYVSGAKFICADFEAAREVVKCTYNSAVDLFSKLCVIHGIAADNIISHSEGAKLGIASNHGDPEHLWRGLNLDYTMDMFRRDVAMRI